MKEIKHTKRMYYHLPKMNPSATTSKGKHSNQNLDIGHEWKSMKIITFNTSGLRNTKKRNSVFKILKKEKADIIALQETYLLGKEKPMIEAEWGGKAVIGQGTVRSMGQMILISKQMSNKFRVTELHNDSRLLLSKLVMKREEE